MILVYNAKSGGAFSGRALRARFKKHGITLDALVSIEDLDKINAYIKKDEVIAVVGGDGTMSAVAAKLAGTKAVIAPLPGGTLNHFTKDLGIPQDFDEALANLAHARIHLVDVAQVNGRTFINNSSIGMYPTSLRTRERYEKHIGKWPAAVVAAVRGLVRMRPYDVTIEGKSLRTPFVFIGNNDYRLDTVGTAERSKLDAGHLCVFVAKTTSRWKLLKIVLWTLVGRVKELDEFEFRAVRSLTVRSRRSHLHVSYDGEVARMKSPLQYEILSKALRVLR